VRKLLGDRVPTPAEVPRSRRKKATAEEVVQARITGQVRELRRLDPLVRHDTPDAVHQMRVAARRLRSALATFRPLLDRTVTDPVRDELKWLGTVLSDVRDAEVLHGRLDAMIAAEYPEAVRGGAQQRIERELEAQHAAARVRANAAMESPRYFALLERLDELAASPPWTAAASGRARDVLPGAVRRDWKRLRRRVAVAERTSDRAERALRLHEARKAAKRARYAAETAAAVYAREATGFVKGTKRMQTVLGEHHDSVVAQSWLRELADQATTEGDDSFTFGVLHAREDAAAETAQARMTKAWRRASRKKRLRWLS
jgi:CHAD domain-containing protein